MQTGNGNLVGDSFGRVWLDMLSGILNVSLGHGSDVVKGALREITDSGLINTYDRPSVNCQALLELLGMYESRFRWKLFNTGAEAIERAIQIASYYYEKPIQIAVLPGSFHGKSLSMSWARYEVPWGNPLGVTVLDLESGNIPFFDVLIYEPVRGWDGQVANEELLRNLCNERGALLIADEMITGFMRCGQRFLNRSADIVISGKGLAQGAPLSVLGMKSELVPKDFTIGWNTTCGGNNLSATIGLHVLRYLMNNEEFLIEKIKRIESALRDMGFHAMGALGFKTMQGDPAQMRKTFEAAQVIASWHDPHLRVGPSFFTTQDELGQLSQVLGRAEIG